MGRPKTKVPVWGPYSRGGRWRVFIHEADGKRRSKTFDTEEDARGFVHKAKCFMEEMDSLPGGALVEKYQGKDTKILSYAKMLERQKGRCAICQKTTEEARMKTFAVDHCHKTGNVRGLLCTRCNMAIGLLFDSPDNAIRAAKYLSHHMIVAALEDCVNEQKRAIDHLLSTKGVVPSLNWSSTPTTPEEAP